MASFEERYPENVPGTYYVDTSCMDCDLCRTVAPNNFRRNDQGGYAFVFRQPTTPEEIAQCEDAVECCPCEEIGNDGDRFTWDEPAYRLVHAVARGDVAGVKAAIEAGDVNAAWAGTTLLGAASGKPFREEVGDAPYREIISLLLENGAQYERPDDPNTSQGLVSRVLGKLGW